MFGGGIYLGGSASAYALAKAGNEGLYLAMTLPCVYLENDTIRGNG